MRQSIRIGNGAGFWGDSLDAPVRLVERGDLDVLTLEYLAELTLSILAHQRRKDPSAGYVSDFPELLVRLAPRLKSDPKLRIVTNAGGLNPLGCARACAKVLVAAGLPEVRIAWVSGDDLLPRIASLREAGEGFRHFDRGDSGEGVERMAAKLVSANAYLGAAPIARALDQEARIVITGRVADASLTLGPALHAFRWAMDDWPRLAQASLAGHLIECGAQVTGGLYSRWREVPGYAEIGYPIAEIDVDGAIRITKPPGTGGLVTEATVAEQIVYEIGDPANYHTPDVTVDFTAVEAKETGKDVVAVSGARGKPPPATLKVSCAYANGFSARGDLVVCGADAADKARACADMVRTRLAASGRAPAGFHAELLGTGACLPGVPMPTGLNEVVLRLSVRDADRKTVDRFCRELTPLITSGPPGLTGYAGSRPRSAPVLSYWPTTVDRRRVAPAVGVTVAAHLSEDCDAAFFEALESAS